MFFKIGGKKKDDDSSAGATPSFTVPVAPGKPQERVEPGAAGQPQAMPRSPAERVPAQPAAITPFQTAGHPVGVSAAPSATPVRPVQAIPSAESEPAQVAAPIPVPRSYQPPAPPSPHSAPVFPAPAPAAVVRPALTPVHGLTAGNADKDSPNAPPEQLKIGDNVLRVCRTRINTESELVQHMTFSRTLVDEVSLASQLYNHVSPVETISGSKQVALLISSAMLAGEDLGEVIRILERKGYKMAQGVAPNVFVCLNQVLILNVSRGHITGDDVNKRRRVMGDNNEGALWRSFVDFISWGAANNASDVHINIKSGEDRSEVKFTIDGKYVAPDRFNMPTSTLAQVAGVAYQQSKGGNGANFGPLIEQQCRVFMPTNAGERIMLRWASMATDDGPQITLRILKLDAQQDSISLVGLGYLPTQAAMFERSMTSEGGSIVMAGVVGSGKSTTLATLMKSIPTTRKVMTLEDPREYIIPGAHQNTVSRSMDSDDDTAFLAKLRTLKRTAFNDLLVGEIRDKQTGVAFQDVVESGHNVYTTVHARRHIGIADRLASPFIGVAREVLATPGIMKLLVYQALLPKSCPDCAIPALQFIRDGREKQTYWTEYFTRIETLFDIGPERIMMRNEAGCPKCRREGLPNLAGYKGRTVVAEMIEPDEQFLEFVRDAKNIELEQYVASLRQAPMDNPDMIGKSALECAIYKMSLGMVDPLEIEPRFEAFQTMENRRNSRAKRLLKVA